MKYTSSVFASGIGVVMSVLLGIGLVAPQTWAATPVEGIRSPTQEVTVVGCLDSGQLQPVLDEFTSRTGINAQYEVVCDAGQIKNCTATDDCPDIAIVAQPGLLTELGKTGTLVDLSPFIDSTVLNANYGATWIDLGKVDGMLYGVWFNALNKSLVWYDPSEFAAHGWTTPTTWTQMMALSETIANATGTPPWSIGNESGINSGWPLTDWFENILLRSAGPQVYDALIMHDIAWTDPAVLSAMAYFGELFGNEDYQLGGKNGTINTSFIDAIYPLFEQPPEAYLHHQGSFALGYIEYRFPAQTAGADYAVFPFPDIAPAYTNAVMGGGDVVIAFSDTTEARSLINFLITTDAAEIWMAGGNTSPNRSVDMNLYTNPVTHAAAEQLANADIFRFDLSDQLPSELNEYLWSQTDDLAQAAPDEEAMLAVLARIELQASRRIYLPLVVHGS